MHILRRYLIAGLLVWLPLGVTLLVIKLLVETMDKILLVLPAQYQPVNLFGVHIPGLGVVLTVIVVLLTGMAVANFFGRKLVSAWEGILKRIPLVRTVYGSVKQVAETIFASNGDSFRKVLLIEYPRKGTWALAFQTGVASGEIRAHTGADMIHVFVPTTPNPTSGFFILLPREDTIELDMSVDDGLKMIISMGVITPEKINSERQKTMDS